MWAHYKKEFKKEGYGRTTYLEAVDIATATQQKSLAALDNISVRFGTENFKAMRQVIIDLCAKAACPELKAPLTDQTNRLESHLKSTMELLVPCTA